MKESRPRLWLLVLVLLTLIALHSLLAVSVSCGLWSYPQYITKAYKPFYLAASTLTSIATTAYCIFQMTRYFRSRPSLAAQNFAAILIIGGLTATWMSLTAAGPIRRTASSRIINDLRLLDKRLDPSPAPRP